MASSATARIQALPRRRASGTRTGLIGGLPVLAWLLVLVLGPNLFLLTYSFWISDGGVVEPVWTLSNYESVLGSDTYRGLVWRTIYTALGAAALATLVAYPMAYWTSRHLGRRRLVAVLLVIIPLWVSLLIRVFAWKVVLGENGVLNSFLLELGVVSEPLSVLLYTRFTVFLTLTYVAIPFVFVSAYTALERIPNSLYEASYDSGASGWRTFRNVVWPLSKQGVLLGFGLAFLLAVGDYLTPSLVGGLSGTMIGAVIVSQFGLAGNWPLGAAMATVLIVAVALVIAVVAIASRSRGVLESDGDVAVRPGRWRPTGPAARLRRVAAWVGFVAGYGFLYLPLAVVAVFSFNDSKVQSLPLVGFTTRWYADLLRDGALIDALQRTLMVGVTAVAIALVVGTAFAWYFHTQRIRGASWMQAGLSLPVLLPGVILGLALAIMFREAGMRFGLLTVIVGHATFVTAVVMFVVLGRLRRLDPSLGQASMDLGANRVRTFVNIVLPQLRTALVAAALLGFTLSFDEVLVTFFLTGSEPTLPVYVFNQLRFGFTPAINAVFVLIGCVSLTVVLVATRLLRGGTRPGGEGDGTTQMPGAVGP